jgi:putative PIN family toxin of toxin-antitoxin system
MICAVLDTNVLVSTFIQRADKPARLVSRAGIDFGWLTSEFILSELADVLRRRHIRSKYPAQATPALVSDYLALIRETAALVVVRTDLRGVVGDPKDDAVLACAIDGEANYLVTGDGHLLALGTYHQISIVTPDQFSLLLDTIRPL